MERTRLQIEYVPPSSLTPSSRNARTHPKRQIRKLMGSITQFGFATPIGVGDDDVLIYGHARLRAALELKLDEVPIIRLGHLSPAEQRAYLLADNRIALDAGWDEELLALEFQELEALEIDLPMLGFDLAEIDIRLDAAKEANVNGVDAVADLIPRRRGPAVTRPGDIWQLGRHLLACGDARDPQLYELLLGDEPVDLMVADPPYNVPIDGHVCGLGKIKHREFAMAVGELSSPEFEQFLFDGLNPGATRMRDGAIAFVFMDHAHMEEIIAAGKRVFTERKTLCVWNKKVAGMGAFYRSKHELIFVFKKGAAPHTNNFSLGETGRYRTNVWDYAGITGGGPDRLDQLAMHPTVKPAALVADAILDCSRRGEIILDPFGGSGTTLIAAQKTGRVARLIEYDQLYCDTIIARFQEFTGKEATLKTCGRSFEELEEDRLKG